MLLRPLIALLALAAAAPAGADLQWYYGARTTLAAQQLNDTTHNNTIGTGGADGQLADTGVEDLTAGIGFVVGRDLTSVPGLRLEGELIWRYRTDWDLRSYTHSIGAVTNVFSDVSTTTLMLNASTQFPLSARWTWEMGAGVGVAVNQVDARLVERRVGAAIQQHEQSNVAFAWGVQLGVSRPLNRNWRLGLHYRYLDLGGAEAGPFRLGGEELSADHVAHELQLSLFRGL